MAMIKAETSKGEYFTQVKLSDTMLDASNSPGLNDLFESLFREGEKNLILSMSEVVQCSDDGLKTLQAGHEMASSRNGSFVLCCLNAAVENLLKTVPAEPALHIVPSLEEAVDLVLFNEIENQLRAESGED